MRHDLREIVLPRSQRRTLEDLTSDLDLHAGDAEAKQSAFWIMLTLSAVIATAGVLADSTATVIGAMIIAPLSTPILGTALQLVKRESLSAARYVILGALLVIGVGVLFAFLVPGTIDLASNTQITGRTSPGLLDLVAALATGLAGALAMSRKDVAAVLPGVAIAISLVPPLGVVGVCLGEGDVVRALGALLLFVSNIIALVIGGTTFFAALGYASPTQQEVAVGADRRSRRTLWALLAIVLVPLTVNTVAVGLLHNYATHVQKAAKVWLAETPGASVTDVSTGGSTFVISILTPVDPPPAEELMARLRGKVPSYVRITIDQSTGRTTDLGEVGDPTS